MRSFERLLIGATLVMCSATCGMAAAYFLGGLPIEYPVAAVCLAAATGFVALAASLFTEQPASEPDSREVE